MPSQITNYQCPKCTGPLQFSSRTGKLECEYCGSSFDVAEIEAYYAAHDDQAAQSFVSEQNKPPETGDIPPEYVSDISPEQAAATLSDAQKEEYTHSQWDGSTIAADWGELGANVRSYNCPSCGAELICDVTTAASSCPYCGNPTIVPGQFHGALKPDFVIPFKFDKAAAVAALKSHYRGKLFLPKAFTDANQINKIQGIYVPFWLFNADANAECYFEGRTSTTHREGDYRVTVTRHYDVRRFGSVRFQRVPTDASKKMPDDLMDSIEPFDYSELKPFSAAYLPGYLADISDVSVEESSSRADKRCTNSAVDVMRADVSGYSEVVTRSNNVYINRGKVEYALLPVWILKTKWMNKDYLFAMNGQTGKLVGDLPVSKGRFWAWCGGLTAGLAIVFYLLKVGAFIGSIISAFFS